MPSKPDKDISSLEQSFNAIPIVRNMSFDLEIGKRCHLMMLVPMGSIFNRYDEISRGCSFIKYAKHLNEVLRLCNKPQLFPTEAENRNSDIG